MKNNQNFVPEYEGSVSIFEIVPNTITEIENYTEFEANLFTKLSIVFESIQIFFHIVFSNNFKPLNYTVSNGLPNNSRSYYTSNHKHLFTFEVPNY